MKSRVFSIFVFAFLFSACGRGPEVRVESGVRQDPIPNEEQIDAAKNGNLRCDQPGSCESAVALVSIATTEGLNRCSGFLYDETHLLTNSHCLPEHSQLEDRCGDFVFAHFLGDQHRACKKIIHRSKKSDPAFQDYAIIELDEPLPSTIKPFRLSKRGFRNLERAVFVRVDMVQDLGSSSYDGIQSKVVCRANHETMLAVNVRTALSPTMTFGDCPVKTGHSGAPLLNMNGEVGAMNQAYLSPKDDSVRDLIKKYLLDTSYGDVAYATQIRCVPQLVGNQSSVCTSESPLQALYPEEYLKERGNFDLKNLPGISTKARWLEFQDTKSSSFQKSYVMLPDCLSLKESQTPSFSIISSIVSYQLGLTRYLQAEWRLIGKFGDRQTTFTPAKRTLKNQSIPFADVEMVSKDAGKVLIPVCKK